MAQFRSTADILDLALQKAGEVINGNSSYETVLLNYLNRVHFTLIAGGTIPIGKDTTVEIDEVWPWSKCKNPLVLELQPKYDTGTISLTQGSEVGAFSSAPAASLKGYHLQVTGREEWMKIAAHTAGATAFEIDGGYPDESGSLFNYRAMKLDYDLVPDFITINTGNNKFQFQKVDGVTLTATLTSGVYSPADLITHIAAVATTAAVGPTITGSYSIITRKFSLVSDLAGPTIFKINGIGDQSGFSVHKVLGFDDELTSASATQTSTYVLGGICRLVEPFKVHKGNNLSGNIYGIDAESFQRNYPFTLIGEGIPDKFTVIRESADGTLTVRFNRYVNKKTRFEVEHVPIPRDLKDSALSIPLVPRKHIEVLTDACTFFLMLDKSDDRASTYAGLTQGTLLAMVNQNRGSLLRTSDNYAQIMARPDMVSRSRKRLVFGEKG